MYDGCPSPWFASYTTTYVLYVYSGWRWYTASCNGCARICRRLLDCSIDDVVRLMIRCVRILYSSTADWHRCTCCLLSWIVVVIRLMYVSMCRMDGYIVRWFEFLLLRWRWMNAHDVCFLRCCNFCRRGTEFLFGEEALPLALPINRNHC